MLYARELQNARPANNKLNVFDLLALFRASQGDSQRHTDEVTLRKLIDEGFDKTGHWEIVQDKKNIDLGTTIYNERDYAPLFTTVTK